MRSSHVWWFALVLVSAGSGIPSSAASEALLIRDARIFDGTDASLPRGDVLVVGDTIEAVGPGLSAPDGALVVEADGRIVGPGFIDLHAHLTIAAPLDLRHGHATMQGALAVGVAEFFLDHGFTTVRDAGGTHPDLARAQRRGLFEGPRIYPSGAIVSQTSGHGDSRHPEARHPSLGGPAASPYLPSDHSVIADGVDATLAAVRENLRWGATQIKIMGGGGVASDYDPIHTLQPSPEEIRAAVQAASDWDTYVLAHAYTAEAIRRLVENGVEVIEHGLLIDEETARFVAEKGAAISTQVVIFRKGASIPDLPELNRKKFQQVLEGQDRLWEYIRKYDIETGFGTDLVFGTHTHLAEEFVARTDYVSAAEVMRQATSESARILRRSGRLDPYGGRLGELREGFLADLLLFEGDPFEDISILLRPEESILMVVQNGVVVRDRRE